MPDRNAVHQDAALEQISVGYMPNGIVAPEMSPSVPVKKESDKYYVYSKDNLKVPETRRADGAEANEVDWNLSTASYQLEEEALKRLVTDRQRDNADAAIRPEMDATKFLKGQIMLRGEKDLADLINPASNWAQATSLTSTLAWSANTTLSNPITFADSAASVILQNASKRPNRCLLDLRTFNAAKEHISIVDRVKYSSTDSVTKELLARLFNIEKVVVAEAAINSGQEGLADSMGFLFTDLAFFCYVSPAPGLFEPSAFYTFSKSGMGLDGGPDMVKRWREEKRKGDFIEVSKMYAHKIVASDCAYHIANTIQ
jgi:hypothetical protein